MTVTKSKLEDENKKTIFITKKIHLYNLIDFLLLSHPSVIVLFVL